MVFQTKTMALPIRALTSWHCPMTDYTMNVKKDPPEGCPYALEHLLTDKKRENTRLAEDYVEGFKGITE